LQRIYHLINTKFTYTSFPDTSFIVSIFDQGSNTQAR